MSLLLLLLLEGGKKNKRVKKNWTLTHRKRTRKSCLCLSHVTRVRNVRVPSKLIWLMKFRGGVFKTHQQYMEYCKMFFFFCLSSWLNLAQLISMCKQSLLSRLWDAGVRRILILIWRSLSGQSQHNPIRGLLLWVGVGVGEDVSGGFVSWDS